MSDSTILNNWFTGELVAVTDMKPINALMLSTLFASNKPATVFGVVPTVDTMAMTFAVTSGFAFFGITADATYISNTGSTTAACTIPAQGALTLVDLDCYIYVSPLFTVSGGGRITTTTGTVYSSTNASDVGIKICDVVDGVTTNYTNNNIANYFFFVGENNVTVANPNGTPIDFTLIGPFINDATANGVTSSVYTAPPECKLISNEVSTNNSAALLTYINTSSHLAESAMIGYTNTVEQYRLSVFNTVRPTINVGGGGSIAGAPGINDIVVGQNLTAYPLLNSFDNDLGVLGYQKLPGGLIIQWGTITVTGTGSGGGAVQSLATPMTVISVTCSAFYITVLSNQAPYTQGTYAACDNLMGSSIAAECSGGLPSGNCYIQYIAIGY